MSVISPEIDLLLSKVDSKYTLCIVAAKRARQINDMIHGVRDQAILSVAPTQLAQITSTKPLTLALNEIADDDVSYERVKEGIK
ncbi:MAG: DNA-directed RNA polymerase subunit omega [Coriobacteriia bacterium]|nr:DNA-directed RNA polymerase subunit omega [Coriobacteriia bacterium]